LQEHIKALIGSVANRTIAGSGASINFTAHAGFRSTGWLYDGSLSGWQLR
jgi:hypothetical protein